jgi:Spy/CpxP family protein refolding chaperone
MAVNRTRRPALRKHLPEPECVMSRPIVLLALLGFSLVAGPSIASAQDQAANPPAATPAAKNPQRQIERLSRALDLNPQQAATLAPILEQRQQQLAQLRADTSLDKRVRRDRMRSIQRDSDTQIQAVLTDSQKQKYTQWKQDMRARMRQRRMQSSGDDNSGE